MYNTKFKTELNHNINDLKMSKSPEADYITVEWFTYYEIKDIFLNSRKLLKLFQFLKRETTCIPSNYRYICLP